MGFVLHIMMCTVEILFIKVGKLRVGKTHEVSLLPFLFALLLLEVGDERSIGNIF